MPCGSWRDVCEIAAPTAHVFTIPAGIPFARALAQGIAHNAKQDDPLALTQALILVPTRRAARWMASPSGMAGRVRVERQSDMNCPWKPIGTW